MEIRVLLVLVFYLEKNQLPLRRCFKY